MEEVFIPIKGYEKLYEISNLGRIKSLPKTGSTKELFINNKRLDVTTGYVVVQLRRNNKLLTIRLHRLLAEHFIVNLKNEPVVNHIDGNKRNNSISNLEWVSYSANTLHSFKNGLQVVKKGQDSHLCKINDKQLKEIYLLFKKGLSNKEISFMYKVNPATISKYRNKKYRFINDDDDYSIKSNKTYSNKFSRTDVEYIFSLLLKGVPQKEIAALMNVDISTITDINKGNNYKYIPRPEGIPVQYKKVGKLKKSIINNDIC